MGQQTPSLKLCNILIKKEYVFGYHPLLDKYQELLQFIKHDSTTNIAEVTGCSPKCELTTYKFIEDGEKKLHNETKWVSSLFLLPQAAAVKNIVERYQYTISDLLADFGSYIGLFLGWSLLSMSKDIPVWLVGATQLCKKFINKDDPDKEENNDKDI